MIGKCLTGAVLALALSLSSPAETQAPAPTFVTNPYIKMIRCVRYEEGELHFISGTGFKIADGRWISANHVTENIACHIDGYPITVTYNDPVGDISTFKVDMPLKGGLKVDCGGYVDSQWYHAQGFAEGLPIIRSLPIMAASAMSWLGVDRDWSVLVYNRVIPGQSGGPVLNSLTGAVVGVVNAYNIAFPISFSRELKRDAHICPHS